MLKNHGHHPGPEAAAFGAVVMLIGLLLLLDRTGVVRWAGWWSIAPLALICGGLAKLLTRRPGGRCEGGWLVVIGAWLLLNQLDVLRYRQSWPLLIVALGTSIIWNAFMPPPNTSVE